MSVSFHAVLKSVATKTKKDGTLMELKLELEANPEIGRWLIGQAGELIVADLKEMQPELIEKSDPLFAEEKEGKDENGGIIIDMDHGRMPRTPKGRA